MNTVTDSNNVMENKFNLDIQDINFFQELKAKAMGLRVENNMPPFVLMTHKKMAPKPARKDRALINENAKKIYLKFYKKAMRKIAPERINKLGGRDRDD